MRFIPISDNDPQTINLAFEEFYKIVQGQDVKIEEIKTATVQTEQAVLIDEPGEVTQEGSDPIEEEVALAETIPIGPSMASYTPTLSPMVLGRVIVNWRSWPGYGSAEVTDYDIYASTEAVCTINDTNKVASNVKLAPYVVQGLTKGQTYDIRVRPNGVNGAGDASD